jgi:hypothetical protein
MERRTRDELFNIVDDNDFSDSSEDMGVNLNADIEYVNNDAVDVKDECLGILNSDKFVYGSVILLCVLMVCNVMSGGEIG